MSIDKKPRGAFACSSTGSYPSRRARARRCVILLSVAVAAAALMLSAPGGGTSAAAAATGPSSQLVVSDLSSAPGLVSGGDTLINVAVPGRFPLRLVRVFRNDTNVTSGFRADQSTRSLTGLVNDLRIGSNVISATAPGLSARLVVVDHPITGPMFSGLQQEPFVCKTVQSGLGQPLVDHPTSGPDQAYTPVFAVDSTGQRTSQVIGYSQACSIATRIDYLYRTTSGQWKPYDRNAPRPEDMATTTTTTGLRVDYIVRWERGTIDRFLYSVAMLAPYAETAAEPNDGAWNHKVVYYFDGGGGIGHSQGQLGTNVLRDDALSKGYALLYSTGTQTARSYNLQLGAEAALMLKEHFIKTHGVPLYTVGVGGSGGGLQQYVYGQHYPGLINAAIPQKSYPDTITTGINVSDCELLEHYMDVTAASDPKWQNWANRSELIGFTASTTVPNKLTGKPGSDACVNAWLGSTPEFLNPLFGSAGSGQELLPPSVIANTHWTYSDDLQNIFGLDSSGYARETTDNVGVQYGLVALRSGFLTPAEFLDLNANVGSWKAPEQMVQEGQPFLPTGGYDPWSSRNMNLSPDDGITPAPRQAGNPQAIAAAYNSGQVFTGNINIPVLDSRDYLDPQLDEHDAFESFITRQRIQLAHGNADNQVIWITDQSLSRPGEVGDDATQELAVMDQWMTNIRQHPQLGVAGNKPAAAVDTCFNADGVKIASGPHVWDGVLNHQAPGACTSQFQLHSNSRIMAGGPIQGAIFACTLQPVPQAISRGVYGPWHPTPGQTARLEQIFPTGVCDYTRGDADRPGSS